MYSHTLVLAIQPVTSVRLTLGPATQIEWVCNLCRWKQPSQSKQSRQPVKHDFHCYSLLE